MQQTIVYNTESDLLSQTDDWTVFKGLKVCDNYYGRICSPHGVDNYNPLGVLDKSQLIQLLGITNDREEISVFTFLESSH